MWWHSCGTVLVVAGRDSWACAGVGIGIGAGSRVYGLRSCWVTHSLVLVNAHVWTACPLPPQHPERPAASNSALGGSTCAFEQIACSNDGRLGKSTLPFERPAGPRARLAGPDGQRCRAEPRRRTGIGACAGLARSSLSRDVTRVRAQGAGSASVQGLACTVYAGARPPTLALALIHVHPPTQTTPSHCANQQVRTPLAAASEP